MTQPKEPTITIPLRLALALADQVAFTASRAGRATTRTKLSGMADELKAAISKQSTPEELTTANVAAKLEYGK